MSLPRPEPGLVIRYDYLWSHEVAAGREQGKERPACLVAASDPHPEPRFVVILPITHSPPTAETVGIEIPPKVREALGLDDAPCWVVVSEHNIDTWPNGGLGAIPGRPGAFSYGVVPPGLFKQVKTRFLELAGQRATQGVRR